MENLKRNIRYDMQVTLRGIGWAYRGIQTGRTAPQIFIARSNRNEIDLDHNILEKQLRRAIRPFDYRVIRFSRSPNADQTHLCHKLDM